LFLFARGTRAAFHEKGTAMNHLRSIIGLAAVASTLVVGSTAGAAGASTTSRASTASTSGAFPSVCYEAENKNGQWLDRDQGCDGSLVAPSGGVYGLAVTVDGVRQVLYSVHDGAAFESGSDGQKVNTGKAAKALRAELSPRKNKHLEYTVTYDVAGAEKEETARDNTIAGDKANAITSIRMKITGS
jgi:hypothetical protein